MGGVPVENPSSDSVSRMLVSWNMHSFSDLSSPEKLLLYLESDLDIANISKLIMKFINNSSDLEISLALLL